MNKRFIVLETLANYIPTVSHFRSIALLFLTICATVRGTAQEGPIHLTAKDTVRTDLPTGTTELVNEVEILFEGARLTAGYAKVYWEEQRVEARGLRNANGQMEQLPVFEDPTAATNNCFTVWYWISYWNSWIVSISKITCTNV